MILKVWMPRFQYDRLNRDNHNYIPVEIILVAGSLGDMGTRTLCGDLAERQQRLGRKISLARPRPEQTNKGRGLR